MTTKKQINANRRNAKKSTGPRSDRGKQTAARNALKHGFCASGVLLSDEDPAVFEQFSQNLRRELNPNGSVENMLAGRIVALSWRLQRAVRLQSGVFDALTKQTESADALDPAVDPRPRTLVASDRNPKLLDNLLLHERRLEQSLYKTMLELQRLQFIRTKYESLLQDGCDYDETESRQLNEYYQDQEGQLFPPRDR